MALLPKPTAADVQAYMAANEVGMHEAKQDLHDAWARNNVQRIRDYAYRCPDHTATPLVDLCDLLLEEM